jgi:hypothetical protein
MSLSSRYPDNWNEIALELKKKANWTCAKCQRKCLEPGKEIKKDDGFYFASASLG